MKMPEFEKLVSSNFKSLAKDPTLNAITFTKDGMALDKAINAAIAERDDKH